LQAKPTQQAEKPSVLLSEGFSAFAAFVSGLYLPQRGRWLSVKALAFLPKDG